MMRLDDLPTHNGSSTVAAASLNQYPMTEADTSVDDALKDLAQIMRWNDGRSTFGRVIPEGARVLIKPNLVLHQNEGDGGLTCLITNASLIKAVVKAALDTGASEVIVGDAPIQGCDFDRLLEETGLGQWAVRIRESDSRFHGPIDFRRTTCRIVGGVRLASENLKPLDAFTLFDLGTESLLEPITNAPPEFRVAWYDHRLLARAHRRGVHQYLVAREVMQADVVINLPKLKTHKKAGVTCALKNLIGINGNKEYLPHHRLGGSNRGGDCYPGDSLVKRALEYVSDRQNLTGSTPAAMGWHIARAFLARTARYSGDRVGLDGSWSGNDTIWRTCLDLNRILLFGRADGSMHDELQRRVIHIVDAIVAGQGNGPLAPEPLPLGKILAGNNAAAVDWIGSQLLAFEPHKIPLVRHSFDQFRWPVTSIPASMVSTVGTLESVDGRIVNLGTASVSHPVGWRTAAARGRDTVAAEAGRETAPLGLDG